VRLKSSYVCIDPINGPTPLRKHFSKSFFVFFSMKSFLLRLSYPFCMRVLN